jgi:tetratricopeptide (TPR) repeat protein
MAGLLLMRCLSLQACIWDSDTLRSEKRKQPDLASLILKDPKPDSNTGAYQKKLSALLAQPRRDDPVWLNEVAGTQLRLGEAQAAVDLLSPLAGKFTNDYGIQANLGTAYHLLGRYAEAERHIARDLELNPDAHFGLEKFHLALLQYLVRDAAWKAHRLYVDEFSYALQESAGAHLRYAANALPLDAESFPEVATNPPAYRRKWNLAEDPKLKEGLLYLASLNPQEPAVFEMLGVLCWKQRDLNLAAAAFEKAIALGSPKAPLLQHKVDSIRNHIHEAQLGGNGPLGVVMFVALSLVLSWAVIRLMRWSRRAAAPSS